MNTSRHQDTRWKLPCLNLSVPFNTALSNNILVCFIAFVEIGLKQAAGYFIMVTLFLVLFELRNDHPGYCQGTKISISNVIC